MTSRSIICSARSGLRRTTPSSTATNVAGGSIRIHQKEMQALNFKALGMSPEKARERFGFFLDALEYGTPPHGGFAAGIERTCMILCGTENIRDVMAFPKTASAQDLMMDSPGEVDEVTIERAGHKNCELNTFICRKIVIVMPSKYDTNPLDPEFPAKAKAAAAAESATSGLGQTGGETRQFAEAGEEQTRRFTRRIPHRMFRHIQANMFLRITRRLDLQMSIDP